ncbi:synaptosomal-associated protein 29 isoform X1 [Schistocerca americana]|uniref:synaptosomal-associated protein 29 isoform X1 n=1 Tax=Schistocerca americana TaxID=7009 RepID=UPI001F4F2D99|nr:synaptosomal-associated protein 29 isoform X1 [Schistocerca americana]
MAGQRYLSNQNSPFFAIEDDVDDETFLRNSRVGKSSYNQDRVDLEDRRQQLLERKREIEERTLASSNRSITMLRDSEQIGVATAEELLRQREQLERTDKRLDDINATLRFSQKHIQGIKSVMGSLKNYFSGKSNEQPPGSKEKSSIDADNKTKSPLVDTIDRTRSAPGLVSPVDSHPDPDGVILSEGLSSASLFTSAGLRTRGLTTDTFASADTNDMSDMQLALDRNLEEMCGSLSRLKGLAAGLGEEIDSQNELLDKITDKTDTADTTLQRQNKDMRRLLGKK